MKIESTRFGTLEIDENKVIGFPKGLIGFPEEKSFIMVHHRGTDSIAWLQSTLTPSLALPVVSVHQFAPSYPDVPLDQAAERAGLQGSPENMAALVVLCATPGVPATVNLAAPIIVDSERWTGVQTILEGTKYSTREVFVVPAAATKPSDGAGASVTSTPSAP
ncbi:MAG TPA: flagellar assembly protein FliW [Polyangiaceae bacterium]|jgi:flagellar assembly factor FliW|nr:flagellar assembly protein FliW [Polyangiaceae bacterium]